MRVSQDAVRAGDTNIDDLGRRIVLPATFTGGDRHMKTLCQNAFAIVRAKGRPSLFITMTCNSHWTDITNSLLPGQAPVDRPDIVARVFHAKLKELLHDLTKKHVLVGSHGRVTGYVHTIEFQKRGWPHAHILLIMHLEDRITDSDTVDKIISARVPNKDLHPEVYDTVMKSMVHGPCGTDNPKALA